jgi:hypothetical protein
VGGLGGEHQASMVCGREASWCLQHSKVCGLGFTCLCGGGPLALNSKLRVPVGQQRPWDLLVLVHGLLGATAAAVVMGFQVCGQ